MPVKLGELDAALQYLKNKLPQLGMFSTLDEAVSNAPQKQMSAEQWQQYLKPGLQVSRAGVNFPLKGEELQYSGLSDLLQKNWNQGRLISREDLADALQRTRPGFNRTIHGDKPPTSPEEWDRLTTRGPGSYSEHAHTPGIPNSYSEDITTSPDFGEFRSHFSPQDISWSRTTRHYADTPDDPQSALVRLIEEIQSDRHEAAAEKLNLVSGEGPSGTKYIAGAGGRRGYRTPEEDAAHKLLNPGWGTTPDAAYNAKPPDTPFKDPADYAGLELRKQLLNSVNQGDQYLALTRGADQIQRYEQGMEGGKGEGMSYIYDQVYPSALKKLARQYGAEVKDVPVSMKSPAKDIRPAAFVELGAENLNDFIMELDHTFEDNPGEHSGELRNLAKELHSGLFPRNQSKLENSLESVIHNANEAQRLFELDGEPDYGGVRYHRSQAYKHLNDLWQAWKEEEHVSEAGEGIQKTFPAMHITPEVAERVRKAGVPLFTLAGATALGLGNDDANATPVEDASMQNANQSFGDGGSVISKLAALAGKVFAKAPQVAADDDSAAIAIMRKYQNREPLTPEEQKQAISWFAQRIPQTEPAPAALTPPMQKTSPAEFMASLHAIGGPRADIDTLVAHARHRLAPETLGEDQVNTLLTDPTAEKPQGFAEGGAATEHEDTEHSSLEMISNWFKTHVGEGTQRVGTGIAKQLYGLDRNGHEVLGGRAWTEYQGGTPAGILDTLTALPGNAVALLNLLHQVNGKGPAGTGDQDLPIPKFSTDAAERLAKLEERVRKTTGVGEAQTIPEHLEDAAAMLATPLPAAKIAEEAPALQRLLEMVAPVRPPTLARYATDSGIIGGSSAALDAISKRIAAKASTPPPDNSPPDTTVEDQAMQNANQSSND